MPNTKKKRLQFDVLHREQMLFIHWMTVLVNVEYFICDTGISADRIENGANEPAPHVFLIDEGRWKLAHALKWGGKSLFYLMVKGVDELLFIEWKIFIGREPARFIWWSVSSDRTSRRRNIVGESHTDETFKNLAVIQTVLFANRFFPGGGSLFSCLKKKGEEGTAA